DRRKPLIVQPKKLRQKLLGQRGLPPNVIPQTVLPMQPRRRELKWLRFLPDQLDEAETKFKVKGQDPLLPSRQVEPTGTPIRVLNKHVEKEDVHRICELLLGLRGHSRRRQHVVLVRRAEGDGRAKMNAVLHQFWMRVRHLNKVIRYLDDRRSADGN